MSLELLEEKRRESTLSLGALNRFPHAIIINCKIFFLSVMSTLIFLRIPIRATR